MTPPLFIPVHGKDIIRLHASKAKNYAVLAIASLVIGYLSSFILPTLYKSTANLIPSEKQSVGMNLLSGAGLGKMAGSLLKQQNETVDRFYVILESESVKREVIARFNLVKHYGFEESTDSLRYTIQELDDRTSFKGFDEGNFVIDVWDESPERAREMCSFYIDLLNQKNTEIATSEARNFRMFVEARYNAAIQDFEVAASNMAGFQKKYGIVDLPEQVKEYLTLVGQMTASQLQAEIQQEIASGSLNRESEIVRKSLMEVEAIRKKTRQVYADTSRNTILMNFPELPDLIQQFALLKAQLVIQEEIIKFTLPMYEQAKMEEAKNLPIVSVLDPPRTAVKKDRPRRSIFALVFTFSSIILAITGYTVLYIGTINRQLLRYLFQPEEFN